MIGAENVRHDLSALDTVLGPIGNQEVINAPANIPRPCICHVCPPRVFNFIRVQIAECINKSKIQQAGELFTLLVGEPGIVAVRLRILYINLVRSNIQVPTNDDGFSFWGWYR